jgi:hypothetical protein
MFAADSEAIEPRRKVDKKIKQWSTKQYKVN